MTRDTITVLENEKPLTYDIDALTLYHGYGFPGGVAHGFRVMQRAFALLSSDNPPERRSISVRTAFRGPGARDAFEMVTRSTSEERYVIDDALAEPERGETLMRYVFHVSCGDETVRLHIRDGIVRDDFIALGRKPDRTAQEEERLVDLKRDMAERLFALPAHQIYEQY
ncbi:hypothetical protein [Oricola sp.]|uniref:hypothetical protein n=1 Tax=Oricola sp. TaxID=1979950 RepID=UPI0025FA261F|nr:hypothetical protein [Oricola sp.]MCI5073559.1 hypothetical protein [Oricola sp.]